MPDEEKKNGMSKKLKAWLSGVLAALARIIPSTRAAQKRLEASKAPEKGPEDVNKDDKDKYQEALDALGADIGNVEETVGEIDVEMPVEVEISNETIEVELPGETIDVELPGDIHEPETQKGNETEKPNSETPEVEIPGETQESGTQKGNETEKPSGETIETEQERLEREIRERAEREAERTL